MISRGQDTEGRRWYVRHPNRGGCLSVTTILNELDEDLTGLHYWKEKHDGEGDAAHHEHLYWYSGRRGTLCHYQALVKFESQSDDDSMWGTGESKAMTEILGGPDDDTFDEASHDEKEITYSVMKNQGIVADRDQWEGLFAENTDLIDVLKRDVDWFVEAFEKVCDLLGVNEDSVIAVEKFMLDEDIGYGGQTDLVYEDPGGNIVVADLKTSSGLRQKHRLQAVAYAKSVESSDDIDVDTVDRVEVWRLHPDSETWEVHSNKEPEHAAEIENFTTDYWLEDKYGDFEYESVEAMWEKFKDLADTAHGEE